MKALFTILAIYMMAVFLMPCADAFQKDVLQNNNAAHVTSDKEHNHDHSETADLCSPFCVCNCCGTVPVMFFSLNTIKFLQINKSVLSKETPHYTSQFIPNYFGEIWQPPQITA